MHVRDQWARPGISAMIVRILMSHIMSETVKMSGISVTVSQCRTLWISRCGEIPSPSRMTLSISEIIVLISTGLSLAGMKQYIISTRITASHAPIFLGAHD